jgi:hypothetical protein
MADPVLATPLKYSDYLAGGAIVTGLIGSAGSFAFDHPELAGYFLLATTIFTALSQWLQSKGD